LNAPNCVCIHAHFYQPPREDPWLESILWDAAAAPYHDWNECVHEQCYKPNVAARLLDGSGCIANINNNYRHISFNIGPTLHSWIAAHAPLLAEGILKADREALDELGAGGAVAQTYNHMIMPLSNDRDKRTQVKWGVADFIGRYERKPEGMWIPETAVDTASLEALAAEGIKFTILAPHQCASVRSPGGNWTRTPNGEGLDVTRPYFTTLPSGRKITLIFYYGSIAHDIAFGGLLDNGDVFADSLIRKLPRDGQPRLLTIATDGESYGHHHHFGEMALARVAQVLYNSSDVTLTNITAFLGNHPAEWECRISERTSWSCVHGIERWRSNCGCHTGGEPWWDQSWRKPLRDALDKIRDAIDEIYEDQLKPLCDSPWDLRDDAAELYLDDLTGLSAEEVRAKKRAFLAPRFCFSGADPAADRRILTLLEAQRMRMFMYTSCGWFFNDISGIETRQILAYAMRAVEHTRTVSGVDLEPDFLNDLKHVRGNAEELRTGFDVMEKTVFPNRRSIRDIAAMASLMKAEGDFYAFRISRDVKIYKSANMEMEVAEEEALDTRTLESWRGGAMVMAAGGLDDVCRLSEKGVPNRSEIWETFYVGDIFSITGYVEKNFELGPWRFADLTIDDKRKIAAERTRDAEREHAEYARTLLDENQRLLVQLKLMKVESTPFLASAGKLVYSRKMEELRDGAESILDLLMPGSKLESLMSEARGMGIDPFVSELAPGMELAFYDNLVRADERNDETAFAVLLELWRRAKALGITIDKWRLQNTAWGILEERAPAPSKALAEFAGELGLALPGR
jgi:alpha-amylase/alpha-mannosidase (GH57 family)